jgi:predicted DNA-binding transcriptional regulator AlpA
MDRFSTREAAKKLGLSHEALARYIRSGKVPAPETVKHGSRIGHIWSEEQIDHVRKLLPQIANGRKTRYQKLKKKQKAPARAPVPHKKRKPEK